MIEVTVVTSLILVLLHAIYKISKATNLPLIVDLRIAFYSKKILLRENDEFYLKRGIAYTTRGRRLIHKQKDSEAKIYLEKALSDFNSAIELNKLNDDAFYQKGLLMILFDNSVHAYEAFTEAENLGHKKATEAIIENGMR